MQVRLITPPTHDLVDKSEVEEHIRDSYLVAGGYMPILIGSATAYAQELTGRQFVSANYEGFLDAFPTGAIKVPRPPLMSVESITYIDPDGVTQTWNDYTVDALKNEIIPAYGKFYPSTRAVPNAVKVTFTAGYGTRAEVPHPIKSAVLLLIGDLFENREAQSEFRLYENKAVERLLWPYRVF